MRIEIATSLGLGKRVIPVLLQGAKLPSAASLPDDLRALVNRQALSLRDEAWTQDAGNQLELARGIIVGTLALYAGVEVALWWKRKRKTA